MLDGDYFPPFERFIEIVVANPPYASPGLLPVLTPVEWADSLAASLLDPDVDEYPRSDDEDSETLDALVKQAGERMFAEIEEWLRSR